MKLNIWICNEFIVNKARAAVDTRRDDEVYSLREQNQELQKRLSEQDNKSKK